LKNEEHAKTEKEKSKKSYLKKGLLTLLVMVILFVIYFFSAIKISEPEIADRSAEKLERTEVSSTFYTIGNNWLKKSESGLWEMYLEGTDFERGVVNGKLTKELAEEQEDVFVKQIRQLIPSENYLNFLKYFVAYFNRKLPDHIPLEYQEEIYGVSLSASDRFDNIGPKYYRILNYHSAHDIGHALQDKNMTVGCTSFGVWNKKTEDGELLIGRNFDFFAGDDFAKNKIVCFTKPNQGNKYMYITWAGFTGVVSGMNDKGLSVTINASKSEIPQSAATPISILVKEILQYAGNITEAYAIAEKRKTFVSESIFIGSLQDNKCVIIEKTPSKTNIHDESGSELICANHYKSPLFEKDYFNSKNKVESSSLYRQFRMEQLVNETEVFNPEKMAKVLRNQDGLNGKKIGLTNEKGVNQLIAHHAVIFKPAKLQIWVSSAPFQLGKFVCYDLNKIFGLNPELADQKEISESELSILADPFLYSQEYQDFLMFKKLKNYIVYCTNSEFNLLVVQEHIEAFLSSNPESYYTYWIVGDYYNKIGDKKTALYYYEKSLTKEIATQKEADKIKTQIKIIVNEL